MFDNKSICSWLLKHPNQDPVSQVLYDTPTMMFADNIALRKVLMQVHGDEAYVKYDDKTFQKLYARAHYQLGLQYLYGRGNVNVDPDAAMKWLRSAAKQGHTRAQIRLDHM
jgi:TPR repeat protein